MVSSVKKEDKTEPANIHQWNWGAFLLGKFWGRANNTRFPPLGFSFNPITNLQRQIDRGRHGSALAWKNGSWDDANHFEVVQRKWAYIGFGTVLGCVIVFTLVLLSLVSYAFFSSIAYKKTISTLEQSNYIQTAIGLPFDTGFIRGSLKTSFRNVGPAGYANLMFNITGPNGNAKIQSNSRKQDGIWLVDCIRIDGPEASFEIIGSC